jgi:uncharacterized protein YqgC (DUF456 family)
MVSENKTDPSLPTLEDMNNASKRGWDAFMKFLAGNVALTVLALVLIALLTVWR